MNRGIQQAASHTYFSPLRQRLRTLTGATCRPWLQTFPAAQRLPDAASRASAGTAAGLGFDGARRPCWHLAPSVFFPAPSAARDFRITQPGGSRPSRFGLLATATEWGHSLYEQVALPRQDKPCVRLAAGSATSMEFSESQSCSWECRVRRSEAFARRWQPRIAQALTGSGIVCFRLLPRRPGLTG